MMKEKASTKKLLLIIGVTILVLLIGFYLFLKQVFQTSVDISDAPQSTGISISVNSSQTQNEPPVSEEAVWYDSMEEALLDTSIIKDAYDFSAYESVIQKEIIQLEDEDCLALFYEKELEDSRKTLAYVLFHKKDGMISQPYDIYSYMYNFNAWVYTYDFDDSISEFIIVETMIDTLECVNDGKPMYFGIWSDKEEVESLSIKGQRPTNIVTIEQGREEKAYYMWYYQDLDIYEELSSIDFSDYTFREVIDYLNITYQKTE